MFKNRLVIILIAVAVVLVLFVVIGKKAGWIGSANTIKVAAEKVDKRSVVERISASGKIYPKLEVKLSPDVSGEITELFIEEGDTVKKGDVLAKIKPDIYKAILDRSVAALNTAKSQYLQSKASLTQSQAEMDRQQKNYDRNKELHDKTIIADADWELIESAYKTAKAAYDGAQLNVQAGEYGVQSAEASVNEAREDLNKTTIYAPIGGVITALYIEKGERVLGTTQMEGTDMMHIADLNAIEARVDVSENDVLRVHVGDTAEIKLDAYPDRVFKGLVYQVANSAKQQLSGISGTEQVTNFVVRILFIPDTYSDLMNAGTKRSPFFSGMSASVEILTNRVFDALTVPIQSVTTREDTSSAATKTKSTDKKKDSEQEIVFVVDGGKVKSVKVETGIQDDEQIVIKSGLKGDEQVVSYPYGAISRDLKDGSEVEVVEKDKLFSGDEK